MYHVQIYNCNNIKEAALSIAPNKLNIIYGVNGTGKSTMAKVIAEAQKDSPDFTAFTPFSQATNDPPQVTGDRFTRVALFNDDYIHQ